MAQPTLAVRDANNIPQTINTISDAGRANDADSQSVALSLQDKAALDNIDTATGQSGLYLSSLDGKTPAPGRAAAAAASPIALSTEDKAVVDAIAASLAGKIKTGGVLVPVAVEFTRPADVIAYSANDSVSDSTTAPTTLEFTNLLRVNGGSGYITRAVLVTNQAANVSQFRLHLYTAAPTAGNDNAQFATNWAQRATALGFIDFDAMQTEGTGSDAAVAVWRQPLAVIAGAGTRSIFAKLETKLGFTPTSGQIFRIVLIVDQN